MYVTTKGALDPFLTPRWRSRSLIFYAFPCRCFIGAAVASRPRRNHLPAIVATMFSKEYLLGIVFIVLVALIWAASSVVAQFVYSTDSFDSPFLLTYIGTSLFTLWLPIRYSSKLIASSSNPSNSENDVLLTEPSYQNVEQAEEAIHHHPDATVETAAASTTATIITTYEASPGTTDLISARWTNDDHLRVALRIAPVWFIANWTYNASLLYTSITSSTVLASTSSLFTFLFAVLVKDERFSWIRLAGVCLGVTGGVFTALHDASERRRRLASAAPGDDDSTDAIALLGDFLGLVSAVGYGAYAVQTRVYCPKDESLYSMQLLLGYIGLLNMTVLSPIAIYVMASTGDLQWLVVGCIFLKGLFDNFLRYIPSYQGWICCFVVSSRRLIMF